MAIKYWEPKALAVAQVATVTVSAFHVDTIYTLTVNGVDVVATTADSNTNVVATTIATAWNASTHPYASGVTATDQSGVVTLTADVAEVPFTVSSSVSGGTGTIGSVTAVTVATGPHTVTDADNWDGSALPSNDDTIVFRDSAINACWGLDALTTTGHVVQVNQSYTGRIGLDWRGVATSADGQTVDTGAPEYRAVYWVLDIARLEIGEHSGIGDPGGSQRCMIDNDRASASQTVIFKTNRNGAEAGKPPVRLKMSHANADIDVRSGVVGIAVDVPGESSTVGDIVVRSGQVIIGGGVSLTNWTQHAGNNRLHIAQSTLTQALVNGGSLEIDGDQAITTLRVTGGDVQPNATGTIATVTHEGGTVDYSQSDEARAVTTHQLYKGATVKTNDDAVTIANMLEPDGLSTISVS